MTTRHNIIIPQGGTYRLVVNVVGGPDNLSGYVGDMDIRQVKASTPALVKVPESCFTVDDINRQLVLVLPDELTADYDWSLNAVYDLYVVGPSGDRWRVLEGTAVLNKTVTREEA